MQSQAEVSELKISLQRWEGQAKSAMEDSGRREVELRQAMERKEEAEREYGKVMSQLELLQGRQLYKVKTVVVV